MMNNGPRNDVMTVCADLKRLQRQLEQRFRRAKANVSRRGPHPDVKYEAGMIIRGK